MARGPARSSPARPPPAASLPWEPRACREVCRQNPASVLPCCHHRSQSCTTIADRRASQLDPCSCASRHVSHGRNLRAAVCPDPRLGRELLPGAALHACHPCRTGTRAALRVCNSSTALLARHDALHRAAAPLRTPQERSRAPLRGGTECRRVHVIALTRRPRHRRSISWSQSGSLSLC